MKQTCEIVFVIDRIGGSFKVLSYSSHRFHEKDWYEERDQGPMSTVVGERIGGRWRIDPRFSRLSPSSPRLIIPEAFSFLHNFILPSDTDTIKRLIRSYSTSYK